jgi:hypothetical protein
VQISTSAALKSFLRHLWYLSAESIAFSFFDEEVSYKMKLKMKNAIEGLI